MASLGREVGAIVRELSWVRCCSRQHHRRAFSGQTGNGSSGSVGRLGLCPQGGMSRSLATVGSPSGLFSSLRPALHGPERPSQSPAMGTGPALNLPLCRAVPSCLGNGRRRFGYVPAWVFRRDLSGRIPWGLLPLTHWHAPLHLRVLLHPFLKSPLWSAGREPFQLPPLVLTPSGQIQDA